MYENKTEYVGLLECNKRIHKHWTASWDQDLMDLGGLQQIYYIFEGKELYNLLLKFLNQIIEFLLFGGYNETQKKRTQMTRNTLFKF